MLVPFDPRERLSVAEAAVRACRCERTIRGWIEQYGIGRKVVGKHDVSAPALQMLLDGDVAAIDAYIEHGRWNELVRPYFQRLGLGELVMRPQQPPMLHQRA